MLALGVFMMQSSFVGVGGGTTNINTSLHPGSGEPQMQKLKSHLVRTQSLNVLPLKCGVGQYIALHATLTARDFFLA